MATGDAVAPATKELSGFEKYLTLWVALCIVAGIVLGKVAPGVAAFLDGLALYVDEAPVVSLPIAACLFFYDVSHHGKIDFGAVVTAGKNVLPVSLTLAINWAIKPFTMYAIAVFFLGTLFQGLIGPEVVDYVKMPLGLRLDLPVGSAYGAGHVVLVNGVKMLQVPLWRSHDAPALRGRHDWPTHSGPHRGLRGRCGPCRAPAPGRSASWPSWHRGQGACGAPPGNGFCHCVRGHTRERDNLRSSRR